MGRVTETTQALTAPGTTVHAADSPDAPWWRDAVIYQIYPRSWADADGDGIGDLPGITARLPYLRDLGVDAVWLSPFYVSPMHDAGYDVADYRDIDPRFGTLADADAMIATAHDLGLKVLVDLVPNHTSSEHEWFRAALAAAPGSPERDRYVFRDGRGPHGDEPPNNWPSVFGGRGWTRVTEADGSPGQWYLHIFDVTQPDLNWQNPEVREELESVLRFWCDRGVDGFRVDVAHGLVKKDGLPDWHGPVGLYDEVDADAGPQGVGRDVEALEGHDGALVLDHSATGNAPMWDQDDVHEIYRSWRRVLDSYGEPDRILCAEAWVKPATRLARYVRADEMHQAFNFDFLDTHWDAGALAAVIEASFRSNDAVGAPTTWVLSNHDVVRHASRLGLDQRLPRPNGIAADDPQPDAGARPAPGPGRDRPHARPARRRVRLPGRGARAARAHDDAARRAPGPDVAPHQGRGRRARRVPGADAVGQGSPEPGLRARGTTRGCRSRRPTPTSPSTSRTACPARPSSCTAPCSACVAGSAWAGARSPGTPAARARSSRTATAWPTGPRRCWS